MRWVALDVHARETASAVFDGPTGEVESRSSRAGRTSCWSGLWGWSDRSGLSIAGPTGYGLARRARELGLDVRVCAPGHIARKPGDRVKTDKRDALRLARLLAAGDLTLVAVPPVEHERLRDLVRCREDVRGDLMWVRHRIGKFLLRGPVLEPQPGQPVAVAPHPGPPGPGGRAATYQTALETEAGVGTPSWPVLSCSHD
jgi:hypothetical protein